LQLQYKPNDDFSVRVLAAYNRQSTSTAPYTSIPTVPIVNSAGAVSGGFFASPTETRTGVGPNGTNYAGFGGAPPSRLPGADWFGFIAPNPQSLKLSEDFARSSLDYSESYDVGLHITYDLGTIKLVSISSYRQFSKLGELDADSTPVNFLDEGSKGSATDFSEEARLESSSDELDWTAGFYFLNIQSHFDTALLAPKNSIYAGILGASATGVDLTDDLKLRTRSASLFGQLDYKFAPQFSFILGGRAIRESQQYGYASTAFLGAGDYAISTTGPLFPALPSYSSSRIETMWAGKAQIEYEPADGILIYAGVNRGVKAGNYNAPLPTGGAPLTPAQMSYNPEVLTSYEAGYKASFWEGRARLDASVFDYDYANYQAFSFNGLSGYVLNRPARSYGGEISLSLLPLPDLQIDVSGSLFHARVKNIAVAAGVANREVQPTFAPEQQASVRAQYTFPEALMGGDVVVGGDMYYTGGFFTNIQNFDSQRLPGYVLFDAQVSWHAADDRWSLTVFGTNLADKRYGTILFDLTTICGCSEKAFGPPRWIGATLGYKI
jgi:iron complex outermembrane receptor protein